MKKKLFLLILLSSLFTGCSEILSVLATFTSIDENTEDLKLHFDFKSATSDHNKALTRVVISRNDTLICKLEGSSDYNNYSWDFPSIPQGFTLTYPENTHKLPAFKKTDQLTFEFLAEGAYGSWTFKPQYAEKKSRWMFAESGQHLTQVDCFYEPWLGKDIIKIETNQKLNIPGTTFKLTNNEGLPVPFELKYKRSPSTKVALVLEEKAKRGTKFNLFIKTLDGRLIEEMVVASDRSTIGIAGKYSDL